MRKGYVPIQDGTIPHAYDVVPRSAPMDFAPWKEIVLGGRYAGEALLRMLYEKGWEAKACREYMLDCDLYALRRPAYKRVELDMGAVQKRIAIAVWKECSRLLPRNLAPDAKEYVARTRREMEARAFEED